MFPSVCFYGHFKVLHEKKLKKKRKLKDHEANAQKCTEAQRGKKETLFSFG